MQDFLTTINKFFVKKDSRILVLSLLCEFIRHQPPHLHQLLQTPLFDNLLECLQIDTSTRAISLAMTALIMFLPHIPKSASAHLPALFNIYSRMLFWDRERKVAEPKAPDSDDEKSETAPPPQENNTWVKLPYLLESEDESVPELLHYFTFLYGLYPINFMSYIRKPQRYLRHANFPGADDLDIEPTEIRERSEPFRRVHLLHPNFFQLTIESELTDNNRWMKSEAAADVVAECMALYVPGEDEGHATRSRVPGKKVEADADIPEQPLLDQDAATPYQSRHNSWRDTRSTAVASPEGCRTSGLHRKLSQASQSMPLITDSPSAQASDRLDSPTLPPQMLPSPSHHQLSDMLNATQSTRGSLYQALTNDSVASLALSNTNQEPSHVDSYLSSLNRDTIPRSPSLRPTTMDPSLKIAYLHREIQLLHNDLNFERYLKQQHLSHIGQLRRKQIREARVEAETQNLINSNRGLKSKLEEAKRAILQMKKETEKSKTHSRKWESDLSAKLRVLREEQKKWNLEREDLKRDLQEARKNVERLKQLVITSESRELSSKQKFMSVEGNLDELERLRTEVESLTVKLRTYEAEEIEALNALENEEAACNRVKLLEMELEARDRELAAAKHAFENEISTVRNGRQNVSPKKEQRFTQDMVDSALSASRHRIVEIQKAHNHLLKRYTALENAYLDLKEHLEENEKGDQALLSGYRSASPSPTSTHSNVMYRRRAHANSDPDVYQPGPSGVFPVRPARLDTTSHKNPTSSSPVQSHGQTQHFHPPQPFSPTAGPASNKGSIEEPHGKQKILPQSEVRVYGRGKSTYLSGRVPFHRTTAAEIYG
jgi:solute carrier family 25 protein 16